MSHFNCIDLFCTATSAKPPLQLHSIPNVEKESEFYLFNDQFRKAVIELPEDSFEIIHLEYLFIRREEKITRSILYLWNRATTVSIVKSLLIFFSSIFALMERIIGENHSPWYSITSDFNNGKSSQTIYEMELILVSLSTKYLNSSFIYLFLIDVGHIIILRSPRSRLLRRNYYNHIRTEAIALMLVFKNLV